VGNRSRSEDGSPSVRRSQGDLRLRGRNRCPAAVTMSCVKLPAVEARDRTRSRRDVLRIADATPEMYRPMVWIGAVLGLRWGEVAGLQVRALDFVQ